MDQSCITEGYVDNSEVVGADRQSSSTGYLGDKSDAETVPQQALSLRSPSDTESLTHSSLSLSETESLLVESVGSSVGIMERWAPTPKPEAAPVLGLAANVNSCGPQFLQLTKEMRDFPVEIAWKIISNHKGMATLCPGIIEGIDYIEGDGDAGTLFVVMLNPQYTPPGAENYVVHKLEVSDDISRTFVVRCVGGMHQRRFHNYTSFIKVVPHYVLGSSSCVITWRLEYELRNSQLPVSKETEMAYMKSMETIRDRHLLLDRVETPLISHASVTKRLKVQARQRRIRAAVEQATKDPPDSRRKSSVKLVLIEDEGVEQDSQKKQRPGEKASITLARRKWDCSSK